MRPGASVTVPSHRDASVKDSRHSSLGGLLVAMAVLVGTLGTVDVAAAGASTPALSIATSGLPTSTQGASYTAKLVTAGSIGVVRWALVSGSLPAGLGLASDGTISGVPTGTTSTFTVKATDSASPVAQTANRNLTLKVVGDLKLAITAPTTISLNQGKPVHVNLTASGGVSPYAWVVTNGQLPAGLSLAPDGLLSGTPTGNGTSLVGIQVSDGLGSTPQTASAQFTVSVQASNPLVVTSTTLPAATVGASYGTTLVAQGGVDPDTWSIQSGSLPSGLTLDTDGLISGQPTQTGSEAFAVAVVDSSTPSPQSVTQSLTLTVGAAGAVSFTSDLPAGTQGSSYFGSLSAAGGTGPYNWSVQGGSLPAGLTLTSDGQLEGVPTGQGSFNVTFQVTDSSVPENVVSVPQSIVIQPAPPLVVGAPYLPVGTQGSYYDGFLSASGGVGTYSWTLVSGALPSGLTLDSSGQIYGTPTDSGAFNVTAVVTDSATPMPDVATFQLSLTFATAAPPVITTSTLDAGVAGTYYDAYLAAGGGVGDLTWSLASGSLPSGLMLDSSGDLYGTPTSSGTFPFSVEVTDQATPTPNVTSEALVLKIAAPPPLEITTTTVGPASQGTYYEEELQTTGGAGGDTWSLASGTLPACMYLDPSGYLYGTPTGAGTFPLTVQVSDQLTPTPDTTLVVLNLVVAVPSPLVITTTAIPPASEGTYANLQLQASGGEGYYTWSLVSGTLPARLYLDSSGQLYGTPTETGTFPLGIQVTDESADVTTTALSLTVTTPPPLAVSTTALNSGTPGTYYYAVLAATGGTGYDTWSLALGTLPGGMHLDSEGELYGYPTSYGTFAVTVQVTDSASPTPDVATAPLSLTITAPPPLTITTTALTPGSQGVYYQSPLAATGGVGNDTWSVTSGSLPAGVTLESDGYVYGTPTASGSFSFTVGVTDSATPTPDVASAAVTLTVAAAPPLAVSTTSLNAATQGNYYSASLQVTGGVGSPTWSVASGTLPSGLTLDPYGDLYGTPTTPGLFSFTADVTDSATAEVASVVLTLEVAAPPPLVINSAPLNSAVQGTAYSTYFEATGGVGDDTWSVASGALPAGLTLTSYGYLSGTPTTVGTSSFTVEVSDSASPTPDVATVSSSLAVVDPNSLSILTVSLPAGTQGDYYGEFLDASGGVGYDTWSVVSGALPAGLTLSSYGSEGYLYGTPTTAGRSSFTVEVTDSATPTVDVATVALTLTLGPATALSLLTTSVPSGVQGAQYFQQLSASGGVGPYTWSVAAGSLPPGMTLDASGNLSGYPTAPGTFAFSAQVTDSASPSPNVATAALSLTVSPGGPLALGSTALPVGVQGADYNTNLSWSGGIGPFTWAVIRGSLPAGLTLDSSGVISGLPTGTGATSFTLGVSDSLGDEVIGTYTLVVTLGAPLQVSTTALAPAVQGENYSDQYLASAGGVDPATWSVTSGALPAGMSLGSDGMVFGTPTAYGTFTFTASATDAATPIPNVASQSIVLNVAPAQPLAIGSTNVPAGTEGTSYEAFFNTTGGVGPYTWSISSGTVPAGLSLTSYGQTAYLLGTPTASGTFDFTVDITDSSTPTPNVASMPVTLVIGAPGPLQITTTSLPSASEDQYYNQPLQFTGGSGLSTWSLESGALPAGLTLDSAGTIYGTPSSTGMSTFTVEVTDSASPTPDTSSLQLTLLVGPTVPLQIDTTALNAGTAGTYYDSSLSATGGNGTYSWSVTSGSLPAGLELEASGSYVYIYGTPTVSGTFPFTVQVTDSASPTPDVATVPLTLSISEPGPLQVTTTTLYPGTQQYPATQGVSYFAALQSSGGFGPYTWSLASGTLPPGLTLSATGELTGYPSTSGSYSFTVQVIDSSSPAPEVASEQLTLVLSPAAPYRSIRRTCLRARKGCTTTPRLGRLAASDRTRGRSPRGRSPLD